MEKDDENCHADDATCASGKVVGTQSIEASDSSVDEYKPDSSRNRSHESIVNRMRNVPKFSEEWFRLKEREISLRDGFLADEVTDIIVDDETDSVDIADDNKKISVDANVPSFGLQFIADHEVALQPVTSVENCGQVKSVAVEHMPSDPSPMPISHHEDDAYCSDEAIKKKVEKTTTEIISSEPPPLPILSCLNCADETVQKKRKVTTMERMPSDSSPMPAACYEDEDIIRKKSFPAPSSVTTSVSASASLTSNSRPDSISTNSTTISRPRTLGNDINRDRSGSSSQSDARHVSFSNSSSSNNTPQSEISSRPDVVVGRQTVVSSLGAASTNPANYLEHDAVIPEAFLVEEDEQKEVALAKLVLPWWKRKRTYAILVAFILVTIGASVGTNGFITRQMVLIPTNSTQAPSMSTAPSSSQIPSFQPSACVDQSSLDPRTLEFLNFNLTYPLSAIAGKHSVIVDMHVDDGVVYMYVTFYELSRFGSWGKTQQFVEYLSAGNDTDLDAGSWVHQSDYFWDDKYSLAMSNYTVLVGTPFVKNGTGNVYVYEYNEEIQEWMRTYEAIYPILDQQGKRFGQALDIDNDLAIVNAPGDDTVYLYLFGNSGWSQAMTFEIANVTDVIVSGDTIALVVGCEVHLFHYNREVNIMERFQEFNETFCGMGLSSVALSGDHLVVSEYSGNFGTEFSDNGCFGQNGNLRAAAAFPLYDISLYHRPGDSNHYSYVQMLNSSDFEQGFGPSIALDEDFLLVGGTGNKTHAFTFEDGYWQESLEIFNEDQCGSEGHDDKVYVSSRNAMVSAVDNVRIYNLHQCAPMPTSVPSESPTPNPTMTCYWVEVFIEHYHANPAEWDIDPTNETSEYFGNEPSASPTLRPSLWYEPVFGYDPFFLMYIEERVCLQEGRYRFTIYSDPLFYNLTSNGKLVVEGREPGYKDSLIFQIPHKR